jgi:uncharacterized glyoxalase superfamily protein PhnB
MQTIFPSLRYRDAEAGLRFLKDAFGFEEHQVYRDDAGRIAHAELRFRDSMVMMGEEREGDERYGNHAGQGWQYVVVEDADAHYERAKAAGAEIVRELEDQDYGSRDYSARDPEGNLWSFGTYQPG